jgi:ABC-type lipoprotein export system ATPase subunit
MNDTRHTSTLPGPVLLAEDVWKGYDGGEVPVLTGVNLAVAAGETVALCGPSGCGKSTLLHLLGGLDDPDRGVLRVNGKRIDSENARLPLLRHAIGFVFQLHNLIPDLTLEENCLLPAFAAGLDKQVARERLRELATRTGLVHRLGHRIQKLSGGERQRTAICRALMNRPGILLADEPTGSLDEKTGAQVFDLLMEIAAVEGTTLLMATHDRRLASHCARLVEMHGGRIDESDRVE